MWVVDDFCNRIVERDEKRVRKDNEWRAMLKQKPLVTLDTREAALSLMVERAKQQVCIAEKELAAARSRLKKCQKLASTSQT